MSPYLYQCLLNIYEDQVVGCEHSVAVGDVFCVPSTDADFYKDGVQDFLCRW